MNRVRWSGAAEHNVDRPLGHVDLRDLLSRRVIDEDLPVGDVDIAVAIDGDALSAALRKGLEISQRAISADERAIGAVLRRTADINSLAECSLR